jgi:hypothetical protein
LQIVNFIAGIINLAVVFAAAVAFFDAARHSTQAFDAIGRGSKVVWMIGLGFAAFIVFVSGMLSLLGIIATVAVIVYHVDQKPKLIDIVRPRW